MPTCMRCARVVERVDRQDHFCPECIAGICPECGSDTDGEWHPVRDTPEGFTVYGCMGCAGVIRCRMCRDVYTPELNDGGRCQQCRTEPCNGCGLTFRRNELDRFHRCEQCELVTCQGCARRTVLASSGSDLCDSCAGTASQGADEGPRDGSLHDYGYHPPPVFLATPREKRWMGDHYQARIDQRSSYIKKDERPWYGMEVEIQIPPPKPRKRQATREEVAYLAAPGWYAKTDSSIGNRGADGVEFVSHPRTYRKWLWSNLEWIPGIAWNTNCGIHIHVSKLAVSQLTLWKVITFFRENWGYIRRISRRKGHLLEQYANMDNGQRAVYLRAKGKSPCGNKYLAVNTEHSRTIEFRIFAGTTNPGSIRRNLAWLHGLLSWASETGMQDVNIASFHEWLGSKDGARSLNRRMADVVLGWSRGAIAPRPLRRANV